MMLRALLVDRFKLVARTETRQFQVFALTRIDGRAGPRLRPAAAECPDRGDRARWRRVNCAMWCAPCGAGPSLVTQRDDGPVHLFSVATRRPRRARSVRHWWIVNLRLNPDEVVGERGSRDGPKLTLIGLRQAHAQVLASVDTQNRPLIDTSKPAIS